MSLIVAPRRHGKTAAVLIILLYFFFTRQNICIMLHAATEQSCRRNAYSTLEKIIRNTAILNKSIPERDIQQYEMTFKALGSTIQLASQNLSAAFGGKIDVLFSDDLHSNTDLSTFNALQSSLLDSANSLLLIASNVDYAGGPVDLLQQEAKTDPSIYSTHISYKDLSEYEQKAPVFIDRAKARRIKRTCLITEFSRDILGLRMDSANSLFSSAIIKLCKSKYRIPVADIDSLTQGRAYRVGGGLDRSKSMFAAKGGDFTVWSTVLKTTSPETGEHQIFILNQKRIIPNTSANIKRTILKDHQRYGGFTNICLENFEVSDLGPFLSDQKIPFELVSPHATNQGIAFAEYHRLMEEQRFFYSEDLKRLESEMSTFQYRQHPGGRVSFGHESKRFKDDHVYSICWGIYSLRSSIMSLYTLGNIQCHHKSPKLHHCFIMGGNLKLHCAKDCDAYLRIEDMFQNYKQYQFDSELNIKEFLNQKVRHIGCRISQAV